MEEYGATSKYDSEKLANIIGLMGYSSETLMTKCSITAKFSFELLKEEEEHEALQLTKINDFFSEEEADCHLLSVSVGFRASFGMKNIPSKAAQWDGRPSTADEIRKARAELDKTDCYLVRLPSGEQIRAQVKSEAIFNPEAGVLYDMQPEGLNSLNTDPFYQLVPNKKSPGLRLILM